MKKIMFLLVLFSIISIFSFSSVRAYEPIGGDPIDDNYGSEEYDGIDYVDGRWIGVIYIDTARAFTVTLGTQYVWSINQYLYFLEIGFTRDTNMLQKIEVKITFPDYCSTICWFGNGTVEKKTHKTYILDESAIPLGEAKTIDEAFGNGSITSSVDDNYDWVIDLDVTSTYKSDAIIEIVAFTYVLTNEEIDALGLDIQNQYDEEVYAIMIDGSLTMDEKQIELEALNIRYASWPELEYGMSMTSLCEGDLCIVYYDANPDISDIVPGLPNFSDMYDRLVNEFTVLLYTVVGIAILIVVLLLVGKEVALMLLNGLISMIGAVADVLSKIVMVFVSVLFVGISYLVSGSFKLLFWWI